MPVVYPKPTSEVQGSKARFDMGDYGQQDYVDGFIGGCRVRARHDQGSVFFRQACTGQSEDTRSVVAAPFGFKKEAEYHGNSKRRYKLVPDPETHHIYQHIIKMAKRKNGKSMQKIADEINSTYPGQNM